VKGNKKRKLDGLPNVRHEFTRTETCEECNCEEIIKALGYWGHDAEYNGHHGDCVATSHAILIPPRRSVKHVVTLGLWCARCGQPARYVQFWKQRFDRYQMRGAMPLCGDHMVSESCSLDDRMEFLYRPGENELFDTWLEVGLVRLQRLFVGLEP